MMTAGYWARIMKEERDIKTWEDLKNTMCSMRRVDIEISREFVFVCEKMRKHPDWSKIFLTILKEYPTTPFTAKDLGINSNKLLAIAIYMGLDIVARKPYVYKLNFYESYLLLNLCFEKEFKEVFEKYFSKNLLTN